ncbi:unnamed protein product [Prorocentrum cordatum]|uniref:Poly(A) RNA polymerase mitochondrial-like central palm domain-containing protein n=1 Tax=Prorocentrum cordatum TaxID=2364126 RepID=A0ABN9SFA8_9DINO|nr:unnamed protein product [Polarella glacialis]
MQQRPAAHAEARVAELGRLLEERLAQSAVRWEEGARIRAALGSLEATLTQAGEEWCVRPFGSVPSTFHTCGADVDVTCLRRGGLPAGQTPASLMSEKIGPLFQDHPRFKILEEVLRARVPILKLCFDDLLDVDLSCQNTRGLQNTRLLRGYAHLDDRVRSLVKAVKLWAKAAGVCGASRGRLSSHSFALLAIYYMLADQEEAHAEQYDGRLVAACRGRWSCARAPAELLERFSGRVVSVRLGKRLAATEARFGSLQGRHARRLHIEDPFLLQRNLNCVLGRLQEAELRVAFAEAARRLGAGALPVGLGAESPSRWPASCRSTLAERRALAIAEVPRQGNAKGASEGNWEPADGTPGGTAADESAGRGGNPDGGSPQRVTLAVDSHRGAASPTASTSAAGDGGALDSPQQARSQQQLFAWAEAGAQAGAHGLVPWQFLEESGAWKPNADAPVFVPAPPSRAPSDGDSTMASDGDCGAAWHATSQAVAHQATTQANGGPPGTFFREGEVRPLGGAGAASRDVPGATGAKVGRPFCRRPPPPGRRGRAPPLPFRSAPPPPRRSQQQVFAGAQAGAQAGPRGPVPEALEGQRQGEGLEQSPRLQCQAVGPFFGAGAASRDVPGATGAEVGHLPRSAEAAEPPQEAAAARAPWLLRSGRAAPQGTFRR